MFLQKGPKTLFKQNVLTSRIGLFGLDSRIRPSGWTLGFGLWVGLSDWALNSYLVEPKFGKLLKLGWINCTLRLLLSVSFRGWVCVPARHSDAKVRISFM